MVDIGFFEKALGREWVEKTTAELQKMAWPVKYNGHVYNGYDIPKVVRKFYDRLEEGGSRLEKTELNDIIIENLVFLFVNEEDDLAAALVAVGEGDN